MRKKNTGWESLPIQQLLDWRLCDLHLDLKDSRIASRIDQLYNELSQKKIRFLPHCWLSDDWFCPDGIPGFAIPFYLAHPRLLQIERQQMGEADGANKASCMRLLRHETAHALLNAYQLQRRSTWKKTFGRPSKPYPERYRPRAYSKNFVHHLDHWYAQSHPHEDWAESFAVWLNPHSAWKKKYDDWPAMKKIEYVDRLMNDLRFSNTKLHNRRKEAPLSSFKMNLREYYTEKKKRYEKHFPQFYQRDLYDFFCKKQRSKKSELASVFIKRITPDIIATVTALVPEYKYRINLLLQDIRGYCDQQQLYVKKESEQERKLRFTTYITTQVLGHLYTKGFHTGL